MRNYIQPGDFLTITAPADVASGGLVILEALVGIATHNAAKGETLTVATEGVFELPKVEADSFKLGSLARVEKGLVTALDKGVVAGLAVEESVPGAKFVKVKLR